MAQVVEVKVHQARPCARPPPEMVEKQRLCPVKARKDIDAAPIQRMHPQQIQGMRGQGDRPAFAVFGLGNTEEAALQVDVRPQAVQQFIFPGGRTQGQHHGQIQVRVATALTGGQQVGLFLRRQTAFPVGRGGRFRQAQAR